MEEETVRKRAKQRKDELLKPIFSFGYYALKPSLLGELRG